MAIREYLAKLDQLVQVDLVEREVRLVQQGKSANLDHLVEKVLLVKEALLVSVVRMVQLVQLVQLAQLVREVQLALLVLKVKRESQDQLVLLVHQDHPVHQEEEVNQDLLERRVYKVKGGQLGHLVLQAQ